MRILIDAIPARDTSLGIVLEQVLEGWLDAAPGDEVHVVLGGDSELVIPAGVVVHRSRTARPRALARIVAQNFGVPRLCRRLRPDVLLGMVPSTVVTALPCPRIVIVHDLRYEQRPEQFSTSTRVVRKLSYEIGYAQAAALACVSERTRRDLLAGRPRLRDRLVGVVPLGSDHVLTWPRDEAAPYALAFGHFPNKNIDLVLEAWADLRQHLDALPLNIVGVPSGERRAVGGRVVSLGLDDLVSVHPWLPANEYQRLFASSRVVVFPSDFEGFGLPVIEAMRLGIPVVITPDPALLEVAGGHAFVVDEATPGALAVTVDRARAADSTALAAAIAHSERYTWRRTASLLRSLALQAIGEQLVEAGETRTMPAGGRR